MADTSSRLAVTDLSKLYVGTTHGVIRSNFVLEPGTFFTLLGPSGCGKTTTLRCIAGLEQPDDGKIYLGDDAFFDFDRRVSVPVNHRNVGMVFQSYAIWPHLTVFENVAFPLRVKRWRRPEAEVREMVARALASVDLADYATRSATKLSGGQQQRVALARAIVRQPRLLLLDEPLSNLDALLRDEMRRELKSLQRKLGVTTVYVTHDQSEALELSDVVAVMNKGRIVQMGPPQDIYFRPASAFVASFMGSTNVVPVEMDGGAAAGDVVPVRLSNGRAIDARFQSALPSGVAAAISIRPEQITLAAGPLSSPPPGVNRIDGVVATRGFLGQTMRYDIDAGGLMLQASVRPQLDLPPGTPVTVEFPVEFTLGLPRDDLPDGAAGGTDGARRPSRQAAA